MKRRTIPLIRLTLAGSLLLGGLLLSAPRPAAAQATVSVDPGLAQSYRTDGWVPVRVTLTNQGAPARVEVRARFSAPGMGVQEYRIPPRELPSGANELHTLYMDCPRAYGNQPLTVELYRDGRVINTVRPTMRPVNEDSWFVYGIGAAENTAPLNLLTTVSLPPRLPVPPGMPATARRAGPTSVAVSEPATVPDRWQGLAAADLVVLSGVSERDFNPEQLQAIREYVATGGTVLVTGGLNWNRLDTPFFRDLLPVRVSGSSTAASLPGFSRQVPSGRSFPILTAVPKPGAQVSIGTAAQPLQVEGSRGAGRVVFMAFDPALPPFREWSGAGELWSGLLRERTPNSLLATLRENEGAYNPYAYSQPPGYYTGGEGRLANAPFAIPQLDIPAFYVVALFLLAYVIILVPVNYFFLKARDKKEYAWLTTPAIVALFSVGAYLIGYGFKGGNTLAVHVGVVETSANEREAPFLFYTGLFSPRKTGYDIQFAAATQQQDPFSNALFSQPEGTESQAGLRLSQEDQPRVDDFAVDMWAMRVLKSEGVADLGKGVQSTVRAAGKQVTGKITNNTPFHLEGCAIVAGGSVHPIGDLAPGAAVEVKPGEVAPASWSGTLLPAALGDRLQSRSQQDRMRRAILESVSIGQYGGQPAGTGSTAGLRLVGWLRDPVGKLQVDGKTPREVSETLMVVRLGG